jgi:hypothetical protein
VAVLSLRDLQAAFGRALLTGDEGGVDAGLEDAIAGDGLSPGARVAIYRHHVVDTLTGVLEAAFPVVTRLVHERFFAYAAAQYIGVCPPTGPCLFEYGASFPQFLEALPPCRPLPYLPDVARLEWALHRARHAEDAIAIDPAILRDLGVDAVAGATFRLHPAVSLLASPWPIDDIWRANQPEADPDLTVDLDRGGVQLEVRRDGDDVVFRALDAASYAWRLRLGEGRTLETATAGALEVDSSFDLVGALRALFAADIVVGLTLTETGRDSGTSPGRDRSCRPQE